MSGSSSSRGPLAPRTPPANPQPYTICLGCGCTVNDACLTDGVPCGWADPFHCTRCELLERGAGRAA